MGAFALTRTIQGNVARHTTITVESGANVVITEEIGGEGTLALTTTVVVERDASVEYRLIQELGNNSVALLAPTRP